MISAGQIKAARAFTGWSQGELAERAALSVQTVKRLEAGGVGTAAVDTVSAVRRALEAAGVTFLPDDGVAGPGVRAKT